ncbi:chromosome segregation in meiosis- protein [Aspergillus nanangensis]|uniref:Chromosome segregation in meiosis protein n=1 Tax=Aspergillus nanangensis TaxID=2582783 RepID=A0AAD4GWY3_ASPNN|nr:chromosome segregation in meiosis- protein [Aspergillus nanangensis]
MEPESGTEIQPTTQIDDLFDYDVGLDGILQEASLRSNTNPPRPSAAPDASELGLGLDEEVKVTRKRQPIAKLDENRLLSQAGIPKLRRSVKQNLKLKGKGHEFSDAARILNFYQLWLDDLFPRAKFTDGLAIIEKLGHSKRIQTMRRGWIEEEKPKRRSTSPERNGDMIRPSLQTLGTAGEDDGGMTREQIQLGNSNGLFQKAGDNEAHDRSLFVSDDDVERTIEKDAPDDDELDALLRGHEDEPTTTDDPTKESHSNPVTDENMYDDAFDALQGLESG